MGVENTMLTAQGDPMPCFVYRKQEILRTPYLTRHRTGQVESLMACDQIEAKIMKYHTLSGGGMSAIWQSSIERFCSLQDQIELVDR